MSYCENYIRPFEDVPFDDDEDDEEEWECAYPGECLMPGLGHHRSECYTAEDMEAYYAEQEGIKGRRK